MIDTMLMSIAMVSGAIKFEERKGDYRMYANVLGVKATLAVITKKQLADALAQTADGDVVPVQSVDVRPPAQTPPAASSEPPAAPVRQRPTLQVINGGAA